MDAKLKADWVKALRSGEFKQGFGTLRNERGEFCCLGVLCQIAKLPLDKDGGNVDGDKGYQKIEALIGGEASPLYRMNDSQRKSFAEIADYIEAKL